MELHILSDVMLSSVQLRGFHEVDKGTIALRFSCTACTRVKQSRDVVDQILFARTSRKLARVVGIYIIVVAYSHG
jgi:hypothetical protein